MFSFFKKKNSQTHKLCYEVDLHSHILPGIDDGSPNTEKSIGLIREMQNGELEKLSQLLILQKKLSKILQKP